MKRKLCNLVGVDGKPIYITVTKESEAARLAGSISGKRFFKVFGTQPKG